MKRKKNIIVFSSILIILALLLQLIYISVNKVEQKPNVEKVKIDVDKIYLAVGGEEKLNYNIKKNNDSDIDLSFKSEDENIATIDENGIVHGISNGTTKIYVSADDKSDSCDVLVTNLIVPAPAEPNTLKELINGKSYTKEENDLLDEILFDRINRAGYKTRAGVVATARFLALEFPYRLPYFSENGRVDNYNSTYKVDGEGRYYHRGLYLNSSRYENINPSMYGPGTWGTYIYSIPSNGKRANGFDCSGFISWVLLNGGFESGDLGAGITSANPDLTDLGEKKILTTSLENNEIKVGDLLAGEGKEGGHIALLAGYKDGKYYVAEALWHGYTRYGAIITTNSYNDLINNFYWHVDMKDYYKEDGNLTDYWIK